jgi:hypothetical protein
MIRRDNAAHGPSVGKESTDSLRERVLLRLSAIVDSPHGSGKFGRREIDAIDRAIAASGPGATEDSVLDKLAEDPDLQRALDRMRGEDRDKRDRDKRAAAMSAKQADIEVTIGKKRMKLSELLRADDADMALGFFEIPDGSITDAGMRQNRVKQINRMYARHFLFSDAVKVFMSLNGDPDHPAFLTALSILDSSDEFNKRWTISASLQTVDGKRQTVNVDIPKVTDDGYMYLNGSKKFIAKQMVALPVVKRKEDQVQVTTQYNKTFVERHGAKLSAPSEKLRKFLIGKKVGRISARFGDASKLVSRSRNALVFEELSRSFISITVGAFTYNFDSTRLAEELASAHPKEMERIMKAHPDCTLVGSSPDSVMYVVGENVYVASFSGKPVENLGNTSLVNVIAAQIKAEDPKAFTELVKTSTGKVFSYSIIRLLQRAVPVVVLLSFKDGLEKVMSTYGVKYEFRTKKMPLTDEERLHLGVVQFMDGFLYYDASRFANELLMNGLLAVPTRTYTFEDMNRQMPYLDFFDENYGTRNVGKGFRNFWQRLVDPISAGILRQQKVPTDFTGLVLACNTLLADNNRRPVTDMSNYRVRGLEIIAQALYQELSAAFLQYKTDSAAGSSRKTIQVRQNGVIKRIIDSQNTEELSLLSPVIELEAQDKTTFKGIGGINKEESFTDEFRTFDPSMVGTFGFFTPISSQAGIARTLSHNAGVETVRGFVAPAAKTNTASQLLTTTELLNPFTATRADFNRIGMTTTQNKHVTPTTKQSKPLINSGAHKAIAHLIGDDFAYKAKAAGSVEGVDEKNQVVILAYDDGEKGLIDTKPKLNKNSKAGFYLECQLRHQLRVGQRFEAGEILAYDPTFFKPGSAFSGGPKSIELATGLLRKVALAADAGTFEDSMLESHSLAKDLGFPVVTDKFVALGKNSHVSKIAKIGDVIRASDPLMVFENSFNEEEVNDVLRRLGSQFGQEIIELGRNTVSSKTSGRVVDVRVFYNVHADQLSPSLRTVVEEYIAENRRRSDIVRRHQSDDIVQISQMDQTKYEKLFGQEFDGVLLQFFVSHVDECTVGDKISAQVALKGVISQVLDDSVRPYAAGSKGDPIDLVVSPMSVISRMTVDLYANLYTNKILVELKRSCGRIWRG